MIKIFENKITISVHASHPLIKFGTLGNGKALAGWKNLI